MMFDLTIPEEYEVVMRFHLYESAVKADNQPRAQAILGELDAIVQKAVREKRLPDDELNRIILFAAEFPDLKQMANDFGAGYADLIMKAYPQKPYGADAAEVIRMQYI